MEEIMYARVRHRRDTDINWVIFDPIILNGEIILIDDTEKGVVRTKIGDGERKYSELPFNDNYDRLIELEKNMAELLYEPITVIRFSHNKGTKENGEKVYSYDLSWEFSKDPISVNINGEEIDSSGKIGTHTYSESPFSSQGITKTTTWTLEGIDERGVSAKRSTTLYFYDGVYYGMAKKPKTVNSEFILSLSGKTLSGTKNRSVNISGGNDLYFYYAYPANMGESLFHIGGLDYEYKKENISFINKYGVKKDYFVYVSDEPILSNISITIK